MVRLYEMLESAKIVRQALARLRPGPVNAADARLSLPDHDHVFHDMEALINQFKLVYEGVRPPAGELYDASEAANGELGFFIVADGGTNPYRVKVRPPSFAHWAAFPSLAEGGMVADISAAMGSMNIIAGELDR
jgi:NADH-quinone oxidoreductase subunit D/NADH-quinone oxidoreductase subunit C/D